MPSSRRRTIASHRRARLRFRATSRQVTPRGNTGSDRDLVFLQRFNLGRALIRGTPIALARRMPSTHKGRDDAKAETGGRGKGSKKTAPRSTDETSGQRSTGARKSGNRPGASGTGPKKGERGSSSRRRSGSRSGGGRGSKAKQ